MLTQVALLCKLLSANPTFVTWAINRMNCSPMFTQADVAFVSGAISAMNSSQMFTQVALLCKLLAANVTLISGAISAMNSSQMFTQVTHLCELPAANLALVSVVRMLWSWRRRRSGVALSMRRVVVSADR